MVALQKIIAEHLPISSSDVNLSILRNSNQERIIISGSAENLEWKIRFKIAVGVAQGLQYLHCSCQRRIIHRDIKASNILLTEDYEPQVMYLLYPCPLIDKFRANKELLYVCRSLISD